MNTDGNPGGSVVSAYAFIRIHPWLDCVFLVTGTPDLPQQAQDAANEMNGIDRVGERCGSCLTASYGLS